MAITRCIGFSAVQPIVILAAALIAGSFACWLATKVVLGLERGRGNKLSVALSVRLVAVGACGICCSVIALTRGWNMQSVELFVLAVLLISAACIDATNYIIPNILVLAMIALRGVVFVFEGCSVCCFVADRTAGASSLLLLAAQSIGSALFVSVSALACALAVEKKTGCPALGGGDVKLLFAVGLYFSWQMGMVGFVLACLAGIGMGVGLRVRGILQGDSGGRFLFAREQSVDMAGLVDHSEKENISTKKHDVIPFGVAIAIGFLAVAFIS